MDVLTVAEEGVVLHGAPGSARNESASKPSLKPLQALRLELEDGVLDNILRSARSGGKGVHMSFGKTITLEYGNRSKQLSATVQDTPAEVYSYTEGKENEVTFTALQSHRLAMKKAQEDTIGADVALAKLQNQLASAEREKQARQIQLAPNNIGLPPAVSRRNAAKNSKVLSAVKSKTNTHRQITNNIHSAAISPSLGAVRSPHSMEAVTSEPAIENAQAQKSKALRIPLIHFLAVRPVSEKYLGQTLGCDQKDCLEVLQRVGKPYRLDQSKWDLNDKAFKELDLWAFNYPSPDDRQLAIDRAISSFDRSRLARNNPLWQKLLPYHERNKGKVLSNLNLNDPKVQRGATPRINLQPTDDAAVPRSTPGQDSDTRLDRLAPSDAESKAKPKTGKSLTVSKGSESDARPKGSLSKESKKVNQTTKMKEKPQDMPTGIKKGGKKVAAPKVIAKSSEFVHDSDEEEDEDIVAPPASKAKASTQKAAPPVTKKTPIPQDDEDMLDAPAVKAKKNTPKPTTIAVKRNTDKEVKIPVKPKPVVASAKRQVAGSQAAHNYKKPTGSPSKTAEKRPPSFDSSSSSSKQASIDSALASHSNPKSLSRQRTTSSPHKPSPLGSSPPTNASDLDNDSRPISSTSSTPMVAHARVPPSKDVSDVSGPGLTPESSSNGRPLKRKATDEDADLRDTRHPLTNGTSMTNGYSSSAKRYKASPVSPPTSESSMETKSKIKRETLEEAKLFKIFYAKYQALYAEVDALPRDAPNKKFDDLMEMHERLAVMKADITKAALY